MYTSKSVIQNVRKYLPKGRIYQERGHSWLKLNDPITEQEFRNIVNVIRDACDSSVTIGHYCFSSNDLVTTPFEIRGQYAQLDAHVVDEMIYKIFLWGEDEQTEKFVGQQVYKVAEFDFAREGSAAYSLGISEIIGQDANMLPLENGNGYVLTISNETDGVYRVYLWDDLEPMLNDLGWEIVDQTQAYADENQIVEVDVIKVRYNNPHTEEE